MGTLTIRLPNEKHEKLRQLAIRRKISINKLIEEFSTIALADFDAETRFRARAASGSPQAALRLLDRLDQEESVGIRRKVPGGKRGSR
jgi:predicted DNA-binding ribbon-helix-helix protein